MGLFDTLIVDDIKDLKIPTHFFEGFKTANITQDNLLDHVGSIQVYWTSNMSMYRLRGDVIQIKKNNEWIPWDKSFMFVEIALYDESQDPEINFALFCIASLDKGILSDINWHHCFIKRGDNVTFQWQDEQEDIEIFGVPLSLTSFLPVSRGPEQYVPMTNPLRFRRDYLNSIKPHET